MGVVQERAEEILKALDKDDRKVMDEYIAGRVNRWERMAHLRMYATIFGGLVLLGGIVDGWPRMCNAMNDSTASEAIAAHQSCSAKLTSCTGKVAELMAPVTACRALLSDPDFVVTPGATP